METPIDHITSTSESAKVKATYDGFRVKVSISADFEQVECACYLYSEKTVISKSGYKNNDKHIFYIPENEVNALRVKVFFKSLKDASIKKTKSYPVLTRKNLKYKVLESKFENMTLSNCVIIISEPKRIEQYEKEGFKPRKDSIPYRLTIPIAWLANPFKDRNWMYQLHAWRMLDPYFNRSNVKDLEYIAKIINDWVSFEKDHKDKWLWYDMSTGLRALKICFYLKKCYEIGKDHQIDDLDYLFHKHLKHLSNPAELNSGNHGLFQLHGLKGLTHILESCSDQAYEILKVKNYANEQMAKLIKSQLGNEGVHTENSPDYHFFTHKKLKRITDSPWWADLNQDIIKLLEQGERAKPWLVFPSNKCVPIGDSPTGAPINKLKKLEDWPHKTFKNYIGARVDGYAIVRSLKAVPIEKSSFLFFQGSFYSYHHKHADDLSFILQENGIDLLIDSGKYGYQQDKYRKYFLSTRAHNTIEVDGESTACNQEYTYGSAISEQPKCINGIWVLKGQVNHKLNKYIHTRTIIYKPGVDLYVIDTIENKKLSISRSIDQWWHFDTKAKVSIKENEIIVSNIQDENIIVTAESSNKTVKYYSYRGYELKDSLIGWVSKSYLAYEPTSTLRVSTSLRKHTIILTRFKLSQNLCDEPIVLLHGNKLTTKNSELKAYIDQ